MSDLAWQPPPFTPASPAPLEVTLRNLTYQALRTAIDEKQITLRELAERTNLDIHWLRQFSQNRIPDPSVNRIEKLYFVLTGKRVV